MERATEGKEIKGTRKGTRMKGRREGGKFTDFMNFGKFGHWSVNPLSGLSLGAFINSIRKNRIAYQPLIGLNRRLYTVSQKKLGHFYFYSASA